MGARGKAMLGALQTMRTILLIHYSLIRSNLKSESPKVEWLLQTLANIKIKEEKVIIFTEFREFNHSLRKINTRTFRVKYFYG
jgi:ERCC4-related helicase